ncbi:PLP-dependent aminotransferase family protein [Neorhizobium galegae]|uniref:aminotransferase-like domain-containing protein n=1 Tax=Neorhizobium galegae TaxID=399 RepID=UPI0006217C96|nr:PLP-dependent aminotransferase family protein [Neorhizobium galegae]CDZ30844.1 Transcriptional regulator with HTH domain and aminotransferase domain [Neorhizobium galegae bv. officinalis]MCQ1769634.1 PLP-dependent aminotransferase family protein [Neorhizobium galegae]MCQ1781243.1 PLP-dependent aminotransferase family protein [Neorhizobium galegae]MCQ1797447.1 PLP-dependent aminotransferase family protein [Neorhizobium galegae]MCQ1849662.1 PLP-dependent aminotransferase family protein [Neorh
MGLDEGSLSWRPGHLASEGPRYLALVAALERDIADGRLSEGDRLPPHRNLARELSLSVGTVSKAYQEAEHRGIINSRVGQGTFVRRRLIEQPQFVTKYEPVNLSLNVPVEGSEVRILSRLFAEVTRENELRPLLRFHPHGGIMKHREIIAASLSNSNFTIEPAHLFLCNGAQHALDIALRLVTEPGDSVLVGSFTYSGFKAIAAASRLRLIPVEMDAEGLDPESLRQVFHQSRARVLYCMPTLQSPTARTMSLTRRKQIAEVAEELDLTVIEDDVYGFFFSERPVPIASLAPTRTFYTTSYSKCITPGFRLGTLTVPRPYIHEADLLLHASAWYASPIFSEAVVRLLRDGNLEDLLRERRKQAQERYSVFFNTFSNAEKLKCPAFYGWLRLPTEWAAGQFTAAAGSRGILVTPPGASAVRESEPGAVRICLGAPKDTKTLTQVLHTLNDILSSRPIDVDSVA